MRPVSSSNSGLAPLRAQITPIALPTSSSEIPEESWKAANESISGDVRTPPKSLMIASIRVTTRAGGSDGAPRTSSGAGQQIHAGPLPASRVAAQQLGV